RSPGRCRTWSPGCAGCSTDLNQSAVGSKQSAVRKPTPCKAWAWLSPDCRLATEKRVARDLKGPDPVMEKRCYRVLLVDDSPEDRASYQRWLREGGSEDYHFLEADTAEQALALCRAQRPDCVLLDYRLPDGDGLDVLAQLAAVEDAAVPVVMLTGQGNEAVA